MTAIKYTLLFVLSLNLTVAQQLSHPMMVSQEDALPTRRPFRLAADTINVLAAMVQFQQDNSPLTTGDGLFDLAQGTDPILDAPPHNRQYFGDHFTFLSNYYRKVSKGKVIIRATVVDRVFSLPGTMQDYSPPRVGSTVAVGNLARDTWQKVDSSGLVPDFSSYQCFVVLHAGTGRDIDLISLLGYDPTPNDIPSLYIGLNAFREYYGSGYEGIPVNGGAFHIANSIIIPETENRTIPTVTGTALLELSINGLLCASVGNFLGLPDLFDTNTGQSGIGRFGLMDGQAIFSFAGLFPPEPSAWEKYWLGWIEPITLPAGNDTVALPAVGIATANGIYSVQDTAYRIPISAQEYFLLENRNRDPQRNGQTVTYTFNGQAFTRTFAADTVGFASFDVSALAGVVTDVEDLDWSLPGGVDEHGTFFDGGALIWHIDEAVIERGLVTNGVNADPEHRGVDLEEADGPQDIGQQYSFLSPGSGTEEGTALDFWYHGNGSPVNTNEFSATSHPDSRSYTGANSHITINNFSDRSPHMTATVNVGDANVTLLPGFPKQLDLQLTAPSLVVGPLGSPPVPSIAVATTRDAAVRPTRTPIPAQGNNGEIHAWRIDGTPVLPNDLFALSGSSLVSSGPPFVGAPALFNNISSGIPEVIIADASTLHLYQSAPRSSDSLAIELAAVPLAQRPTTSPLVTDSMIAVGATKGTLYLVARDGSRVDSIVVPGDTSAVVGIASLDSPVGFVFTTAAGRIASNLAFITSSTVTTNQSLVGPPVVGTFRTGSSPAVICAGTNGLLFVYDISHGFVPHAGFPVNVGGTIDHPPALADLDGDGIRDIIVFSGDRIFAYNLAGASLDNFPKPLHSVQPITSNPVVADVDGDGDPDVVAVTEDGLVVAYDKNGTMASGFPLQAGIGNQTVAAFSIPLPPLSVTGVGLAVASSDNASIVAWKTGTLVGNRASDFSWPQYQHDAQHTGLATETLTGMPISSQFFPKERAYNWPNPVYDGKTFIRYFVKENATVSIKVFDLAGDLVTTIPNPPGVGGVDNEVEWNVGSVQSGVYFARIEASGGSGSGVAVIKIAVVK